MKTNTAAVLGGVGILALIAIGRGRAGGSSASEGEIIQPPKSSGDVKRLAERFGADVKARGYDYDRQWCKDFQTAAGFEPDAIDGIYGPVTAAALRVYVPDAPAALFKAKAGTEAAAKLEAEGENLPEQLVIQLARKLKADIIARKYDYDRQLCKSFQIAAGIEDDEIYGPLCAQALDKYAPPAPPALFQPKAGTDAAAKTAKLLTIDEAAKRLSESDQPYDVSELDNETIAQIEASNIKQTTGKTPDEWAALRAAQLAAGKTPASAPALDEVPFGAPFPASTPSPPTPINLELARREAPNVAKHIAQKGKLYSRQMLKDFQKHAGIKPDGKYGPISNSALRYFGVVNPPDPLFEGSRLAYTPPK